jgi:hypothetical protein
MPELATLSDLPAQGDVLLQCEAESERIRASDSRPDAKRIER